MKAYVYFISYVHFGVSRHYPVFCQRRLSDEEFNEYCLRAHNSVSMDYFDSILLVSEADVCRLIRDKLCEDYPELFFRRDIKSYCVNDTEIGSYSCF